MDLLAIIFLVVAVVIAIGAGVVIVSLKKKLGKLESLQGDFEEKQQQIEARTQELTSSLEKISLLEGKIGEYEEQAGSHQEELQKRDEQIANLREAVNADSFDGLFPICSHCKDIRDADGSWHQIEEYIANLSVADFSHSLCPKCAKKLYPDMFEDGKKMSTLTWK